MPPKPRRGRRKDSENVTSDIEEDIPEQLHPPRPFTVFEGLPVSEEEPEYNLLTNALSLKDSAVLYSSLMKSRKAYVQGNLFSLYWAKTRTKAENEASARDKMNKLCDCVMEAGPHTFDMRFFILKDEAIEKRREEEKNMKKEKRLANKKMREEKMKVREMKLQGKSSLPAGTTIPSATETPIPSSQGTHAAGTSVQVKDASGSEDEKDNDGQEMDDKDSPDLTPQPEAISQPEDTLQAEEALQPDTQSELENTPQAAEETLQPDNQPQPENTSQATEETLQPDNQSQSETPAQVEETSQRNNLLPQSTAQQPESTSKKPLPPLQVQRASSSSSITKAPAPVPAPPIKRPVDPMQTPESQMMIANLNAIARVDPSLNALMKVVATGAAKPEQIREFQGYIQRAKAMGPAAGFKPTVARNTTVKREPAAVRPPKEKKPKVSKDKQLTTFQELYVNGADLVFEFQELPNVRYNLPKDCIVEKTGEGEFLVSFMVVHNREEIEKFVERKRVKLEKAAAKEKAELDAAATKDGESLENTRRSTRTRTDEGNEKKETKTAQPKDEPQEPIPYYTCVTIRLSGIAERYDPILLNSFNKFDDVKSKMEKIIAEGVKVPKYFVWYTVDAFKDEELAENLRQELYLVENPPKGKYKKRGRPLAHPDSMEGMVKRQKV